MASEDGTGTNVVARAAVVVVAVLQRICGAVKERGSADLTTLLATVVAAAAAAD